MKRRAFQEQVLRELGDIHAEAIMRRSEGVRLRTVDIYIGPQPDGLSWLSFPVAPDNRNRVNIDLVQAGFRVSRSAADAEADPPQPVTGISGGTGRPTTVPVGPGGR